MKIRLIMQGQATPIAKHDYVRIKYWFKQNMLNRCPVNQTKILEGTIQLHLIPLTGIMYLR